MGNDSHLFDNVFFCKLLTITVSRSIELMIKLMNIRVWMLFWTIGLKFLFLSWAVLSSVLHLSEFLHVKILPIKVVAGKDFLSLSWTGLLRYTIYSFYYLSLLVCGSCTWSTWERFIPSHLLFVFSVNGGHHVHSTFLFTISTYSLHMFPSQSCDFKFQHCTFL